MLKLEILNHWIVPQQGKNPSEIDEEPLNISPNLVPALLVSGCVASNLTKHSLCGTMPLSAAYGDLSHLQMLERFLR
jgi:hypothetical protein